MEFPFLKRKPRAGYLAVAVVHTVLCFVAFRKFWTAPADILIGGYGDGLKNLFTLQTYVQQPDGVSPWRYTGMAYPFGDFIYHTDNTPLFALLFRWLSLHVYDLSAHAAPIFLALVVLNIVVCGLLAFSLFRRCLQHQGLAFAAAIVLSWINPMVMRLPAGTHNLSLSALVLCACWLVMRWQRAETHRARWAVAGGSVALIVAGFLTHVYFLPILAGILATALFAWTLHTRARKESVWKAGVFATIGVPVAAAAIVGILLQTTDGYAAMRNHRGMGYDWMEMKTRFLSFFSPYSFQRFPFPVKGATPADHLDRSCYLGSVGLWLLTIMLVMVLGSRSARIRYSLAQRGFWRHPVMMPLAVAALLLLAISFGERYQTGPEGVTLTNIFNPFLYLRPLVPKLENFRALARFSWPFYFVFYLWLLYTARYVFSEGVSVYLRRVLVGAFVVLGTLEVKDFVDSLQSFGNSPNRLSRTAQEKDFSSLRLDFARYQALLPLPLYLVGSEDMTLVIDEKDDWSAQTYALALRSRLPLMSVKLSRTPQLYSRAVLQTFGADSMPRFMRRRMDDRPVLIAYNRQLASDSVAPFIPSGSAERDIARKAYFATLDFPRRHGLKPIDSTGNVLFYAWHPPPMPAP